MEQTELRVLFDGYLRARGTEKLSPHTLRRYANEAAAIDTLLALHLGHSGTPADLTTANLREAFARYAEKHAKSSIAGCWSTWNGFLDHLVETGRVTGNPMAAIRRPKVPPGVPLPLKGGASTVERLLASVGRGDRTARNPWPERDLAVVALYVTTGVRQQELAAATVGDLDGPDGAKTLRVLGKGSKVRWVPVPDETKKVVDLFQDSRRIRLDVRGGRIPPGAPLVCTNGGGRLTASNLRWLVDRCYQAAGVRSQVPQGAFIHALRHTLASELAEGGAAATDIQGLLGHASLASSQRYIQVSGKRIHEVSSSSSLVAALRHSKGQD